MSAPDLDLEALREVVDAATPGNWVVKGDDPELIDSWADHRGVWVASAKQPETQGMADAALIVAAVNALPVLLDDLEITRASVTRWRTRAKSAQNELSDIRTTIGLNNAELWTEADSISVYRTRAEQAEAEVARLTAVVQGVRDFTEQLTEQGDHHVPGCVGQADCAKCVQLDLSIILAGGTDTPKGEGE